MENNVSLFDVIGPILGGVIALTIAICQITLLIQIRKLDKDIIRRVAIIKQRRTNKSAL